MDCSMLPRRPPHFSDHRGGSSRWSRVCARVYLRINNPAVSGRLQLLSSDRSMRARAGGSDGLPVPRHPSVARNVKPQRLAHL